jgi:hypothetical protein
VYPGSCPAKTDDIVAEVLDLPAVAVAANSWFEEQFNAEKQTRVLDAIIRAVHQRPLQGTNPPSHIPKDNRSGMADEKKKTLGEKKSAVELEPRMRT